jgi:hypothetical protein
MQSLQVPRIFQMRLPGDSTILDRNCGRTRFLYHQNTLIWIPGSSN